VLITFAVRASQLETKQKGVHGTVGGGVKTKR
jgi:hypothetical protein